MYKVGDEVLVKAKITNIGGISTTYYDVKFGCSDTAWVSEKEVVADKTYEQGLADAWELAKKICLEVTDGGIPCVDLYVMFGSDISSTIFINHSYEEALAKIEAYEKEKEIKPTDIVEYNGKNWVVTEVYKGEYSIWNGEKVVHTANVKKVGSVESIEPLAELLRQIGE